MYIPGVQESGKYGSLTPHLKTHPANNELELAIEQVYYLGVRFSRHPLIRGINLFFQRNFKLRNTPAKGLVSRIKNQDLSATT